MPKLLVVEDENNPREALAETLRETYFEVDGADNPADAFVKATAHPFDLVICDSTTLNVDGSELLELLRAHEHTRAVPFILIAARYDKAAMRRAMNLGADDYLIRPFTSQELIESVMARLHRSQVLLEAAEMRLDATKRALARMLTHELRTPLISMNTAISILSRESKLFTPEETSEMLDTIASGVVRLSHRVEQLAFVTQLQTQTLSYRVISTQGIEMRLSDLVMASINLARRLTGIHDDRILIKHGDAALDAMVVCNPPALKQAITELIANALLYSPPNSTVFIGQKYVPEGVRITITDQGPGIADDRLLHAHELFSQIDRQTNEQQGLGVGLTLARQIVDVHGGKLDIRSIVGTGTQALIYLPVVGGIKPLRTDKNATAT